MLVMLFLAGLAEGTVATDADDAVPAGGLVFGNRRGDVRDAVSASFLGKPLQYS